MVQKYHEQQAKSTEKAGDEMVQKYHEQQSKPTEPSKQLMSAEKIEEQEQYTYDGNRVLKGKTIELYKGKTGGYKIVSPIDNKHNEAIYYNKDGKRIHGAVFNQDGLAVFESYG